MIELINVSKYYMTDFGRHYVFRNVSLRLPLDKSVAVIGPNGAGKSTFLRLLGGADIPSEGRILKTGRISPPMGLTPGLQSTLTAAENARFAGRIYGMSRDEIAKLIDFVRELSKIGKFFDMPVGTYSAGMKQRVAFAINMSMTFDYYLFDEVGAGGDREFRKSAKVLIEDRLKTSKFIIASHRRDELLDICDSGIVIRDGTLTFFDDIKDALASYNTEDDDAEEDERQQQRRVKKGKPELTPEELAAKKQSKAKRRGKSAAIDATPEEQAALDARKAKRRSKSAASEATPEEQAALEERKAKRRSVKPKPEVAPEVQDVLEKRKAKRQSVKTAPEVSPEELALLEKRKAKRRGTEAAAPELAVPDGGDVAARKARRKSRTHEAPTPEVDAISQLPPDAASVPASLPVAISAVPDPILDGEGVQSLKQVDDRKSRREERRARLLAKATPEGQPAASLEGDEPAPQGNQAVAADGGRREALRARRLALKSAEASAETPVATEASASAAISAEPVLSGAALKAERARRREERRLAVSAKMKVPEKQAVAPDTGLPHETSHTGEDGPEHSVVSGGNQHVDSRLPHRDT